MKSVYWNNIVFQDKVKNMKDEIQKTLSVRVKALRESLDLTQEELASKCNVSWRTISNLERGLVVPDLVMLIKIASIFGVSIDSLLELKVDETKSRLRLEREEFLIEKIRRTSDKVLDYLLDQVVLLFKYFN